MKKLLGFLVILFVTMAGLAVGKNILVKIAVERGVTWVTGLPLTIGSLDVGLANTYIGINDLELSNPKGFSDRTMVNLPEIYVNYDLSSLLKGKIHLEDLRLHLREFEVVKNERGELNLDALKSLAQQKKSGSPSQPSETKKKGGVLSLQIDNLDLNIEKVVFKDYYQNGVPSTTPIIKEFPINLHEKHQNISDPNTLVSLIIVKALAQTTIASLTNFDITGLEGTLSNTLASSTKMAALAGNKAGTTLKGFTGQPGTVAIDSVEETAKKGTAAVKGLFGGIKKSLE